MRAASFLMGGLVGAACAMYLSRNNNRMIMGVLSQAGQSMNQMMNSMRSMMGGNASANQSADLSNVEDAYAADHAVSADSGLDQVQALINEDPQLQHQVNEILQDNNESYQPQ